MRKARVFFSHPKSSDNLINQRSFLSASQSSIFCIASVFFLFVIYNLTISPTIYWRDAPEFVDTAYSFGIAHPAGFPAYSTISKLFTFLPISNIAMRVNYVSLFFAILTCWVTFYIIIDLINICFKPISSYGASLAAALGVLFLGCSASYWWQATVAEVYTMNCFFLSIFFLSSFRWYQSKEPKYLMLASFVFGLSTAVYGANLLFVPVLLVFYLLVNDDKKFNKLFLVTAFFLLGYSIYLYLPVRSLTNPTFDWGNPETITNFISHIMDRKDKPAHFDRGKNLPMLFNSLAIFGKVVISEITLAGFVLTIVGLICHLKKDRKSFFLVASVGAIHTLFFLTSFGDITNGSAFLVTFFIFVLWIGLGIYFLKNLYSNYTPVVKLTNIIIPIAVSFMVFSFTKNYPYNDKSYYYLPEDHSLKMYVSVEQNAIILSYHFWFPFRYYKDVKNLRPDVTILFISDMIRPNLFNKVIPERYPMLNFPPVESKRENQHEFIQLLISKNINDNPIYWDFKRGLIKYNYQYLIPENNFLMRVSKHKIDKIPKDVLDKYILQLKELIRQELDIEYFFLDQNIGIRYEYEIFLSNFSSYLMARKNYPLAISFLKFALSITDSNSTGIKDMLGLSYIKVGEYNKAETIFKSLYNTEDYGGNYNLALLYFRKGELKKSKSYLNESLSLNKDYINSRFLQGLIFGKEGNYDHAIKEINFAIEKTKFIPDKKRMQETLERVKSLKMERDNLLTNSKPPAISD